ncbi:cystathionine gamma-synthase [Oricola indica]|uniref:cystathionine gamma-synthase n=1 Tax=Oricola indica TaxID=2872591 RepID=UPI003CCBE408
MTGSQDSSARHGNALRGRRTGLKPETLAATVGVAADRSGAVAPPLHLSSTFAFRGLGKPNEHEYSRTSNPTRDTLGEAIAALEEGAGAIVTSSGMAAINLALYAAKPGDLVVAPHDCYGGTYRLLSMRSEAGHFDVQYVDMGNSAALDAALARRPAIVFIETPSNPLLRVTDIATVAAKSRAAGSLSVVDNTFLSPALQRPILLGADLVVHSTTKYLNGHSDVISGAIVAAETTQMEWLQSWANATGTGGAPFDSYLALRGIRTLFVRTARQEETARSVAAFLSDHPGIAAVNYPGLTSHPQHAVAKKQQTGFGSMLSFRVAGGDESLRRLVATLRVFCLAESLGGVESLVAHPATMTHAGMSTEARCAAGVTDDLLRLSIGLEHPDDLIGDLACALETCAG